MLAEQLPLRSTLQLWDLCFAMPSLQGFNLIPYVGLAILGRCTGMVEDQQMDRAQIEMLLNRLPPLDMRQIVAEAQNLHAIAVARGA